MSVPTVAEMVLISHQRRDIKGCSCGKWGSDHGHLGQSHSAHVIAELERAGITFENEPRCYSCEHRAVFHQLEGCWYSVTDAKPGTSVGCNCIGLVQ